MTRDRLVEGTVVEALPHALFGIALDDGRHILGHISGALEYRWIRVLPGDRVEVELTPYDTTRGRIVGKRA